MSLSLYNTLSASKQPFVPREAGKVNMYVCGMTVYDYCHLGHARMIIAFDVLYRHLLHLGYDVKYVRNITDIDDKIIQRAQDNNEPWQALTERFIQAMRDDFHTLNNLPPTLEPKATDHIEAMQSIINTLIDKGNAYAADNGDVYYRVKSFADYGKLSKRNLDELRAGERVEVNTGKQDPLDFVLWKAAKPDEPAWDSPWGKGRPGWHIECSAMSGQHLGQHFDLHGGGLDLQFPHHENEIAQSEAANGCCMANFWVHNGFVRVNDEKMSKSLGNFFTVRDILARYSGEEIRWFVVSSHYRSALNYSDAQLDAARAALDRLYGGLRGVEAASEYTPTEASARFDAAMNDDLNSALAVSVLHECLADLNKAKAAEHRDQAAAIAAEMIALGARLGVLQQHPETYCQQSRGEQGCALDDTAISALVAERDQARRERNFARADEIRDELAALSIVIEDAAGGSQWRRNA